MLAKILEHGKLSEKFSKKSNCYLFILRKRILLILDRLGRDLCLGEMMYSLF